MAVSPARAASFEILLKIERDKSYASELLHASRFAKLSSADHGLATELVMGVLRWRPALDRSLVLASSKKLDRLDDEVLAALRLGAYQLKFLSRIPQRAAIFESVELVKAARKSSAAPFVNAVLRKVARAEAESGFQSDEGAVAAIRGAADAIALARNAAHPEWLVARWGERYGLDMARKICEYDQRKPPMSIRIYDASALEELREAGVELLPGYLLSAARTVASGEVTRTGAWRQGLMAIQDEASQLVGLLVGRGKTILDCCAAPGGKTALVASRNQRSSIVALELHRHRARLLRRLARHPNIHVVAADARQMPFSAKFERVLTDVPCSGTGTLARNPEIKWRVTADDLQDLHTRQAAILKSALAQLAKGGRLVYSTCSLEREENEAVVEAAIAGASEFSIVDCRGELAQLRESGELSPAMAAHGIESLLSGPYLRTIPGVHACDGFFAAIIERKK